MTSREQPPDPPAILLETAERATPRWLHRITVAAARRGGVDPSAFDDELERMVADRSEMVCHDLAALLALDVDEQPGNPLSVFRTGVAGPTELLRRHDVPARPVDPFLAERFPDDAYGLSPATWADVDPELHDPGMMWGAWKAMEVLRRRRDEGRR